jgi:hypothetical protein
MCKHCLEQFEDEHLAYILVPEKRLQHPAADAFAFKFCSRAHLEEFLRHIANQRQAYVLTKVSGAERKTFPAAGPLDLLLQMSKVS